MTVCDGVGCCVCEMSDLSDVLCECCVVLLLRPPSVSRLISISEVVLREGSDWAVMGEIPLACPFITFLPISPMCFCRGLEHTWRSPVDGRGGVLVWGVFSGGGMVVGNGCTDVSVFLLCWVESSGGEWVVCMTVFICMSE